MEHLHLHGKYSWLGTIATTTLGIMAKITANDVLVYVSIITGLVTLGYTIDKWLVMRKMVNKGKKVEID